MGVNRITKIADIPSTAVASTATVYTDPIKSDLLLGAAWAWDIILAGTGPDVTVTQQVSRDDNPANFKDPYNTTDTLLGTIATSLNASRWIEFSPRLAPYLRMKITGIASNGADVTIEGVVWAIEHRGM